MSTSPEQGIRILATDPNVEMWISYLNSVLGQPEYLLTPELDADSIEEIATYFFPKNPEEEVHYPEVNGTLLTISRILAKNFPDFSVDLRTYGPTGKQSGLASQKIAEIQIDTEKESVYFWTIDIDGTRKMLVGISALGEVISS